MNIKKLNEAIANKDHASFLELIGECTAKDAAILEGQCSADFSYMLWSGVTTWGFEVLWASEYLLPPEERNPEIELPPAESLAWDTQLKKLGMWAPQDRMLRIEGAIA